MDEIRSYLSENPKVFGLLLTLFGVVMLVSAIRGSNWLFKNDVIGSTDSLDKIDGWINIFGVKAARVVAGVAGVLVILSGLFWFLASIL